MKKVVKRSECPISHGLDFFGDKWTFLIIRDIAMKGFRFYNEFLGSGEGIATNILSDRLKMLETKGFLISKKYELLKTKKVYTLTENGLELIPIMLEMSLWGFKHDDTLITPPGSKEVVYRIEHDRDNLLKEIIVSIRKLDAENFG